MLSGCGEESKTYSKDEVDRIAQEAADRATREVMAQMKASPSPDAGSQGHLPASSAASASPPTTTGVSPATPAAAADDPILVTVGGEPHHLSELNRLATYQGRRLDSSDRSLFLQDFARFELLAKFARELKMEEDQEYRRRLDNQYRELAATTIFNQRMAAYPPLDEARLQQEYQNRQAFFHRREVLEVEEFRSPDLADLQKLPAQLAGGKSFAEVSKTGAIDPRVRYAGPLKIRAGQYPVELYRMVKALSPGSFLQIPVRAEDGGILTVRLLRYEPEQTMAYPEVRDSMRQELESARIAQTLQQIESEAIRHFPVTSYPESLQSTDSTAVVARIGDTSLRRDDLLREVAVLPRELRATFLGENGMQELLRRVTRKILFARYAFEIDPEFRRKYETTLKDLAKQELVKVYIERHVLILARPDANDVRRTYQQNLEKYRAKQVRLRNISFVARNAQESPGALTRARGVLDRLRGGDPFEELAKSQSEDTETRPMGGDMGWKSQEQLIPQIASAVDSLEPGEISTFPVYVPDQGFHLLKVDARRDVRPLEEVIPEIEPALAYQKQEKLLTEMDDKLRRRWPVEIFEDRLPPLPAPAPSAAPASPSPPTTASIAPQPAVTSTLLGLPAGSILSPAAGNGP